MLPFIQNRVNRADHFSQSCVIHKIFVSFVKTKIIQMEIQKRNSDFQETIKLIKSMINKRLYCGTSFVKNVVFIVIFILHMIFVFAMICNAYCLSSAFPFCFDCYCEYLWYFSCFLSISCVMHLVILIRFVLYIDISS